MTKADDEVVVYSSPKSDNVDSELHGDILIKDPGVTFLSQDKNWEALSFNCKLIGIVVDTYVH